MTTPSSALESLYQEELYSLPSPVLFILNQPWETIADPDKTVLTKMIGALRLSLASVRIITRSEFTLADIAAYAPTKVIALGATFKASSELYKCLSLEGVSVVAGDALPVLDDVKKKNLWLALRQMFGV
ncbi:hypothetical protein [Chryseolinea soli]|uniref:Uncharacterized protein n=1 Tax=Chryseolinea soli TaxID=2321403 RepID=A0A385SUR6_9BACT|nr:hypothetical protein [Chryseolinea soli]AYB34041.1 hypothetical protein D4L85_27210 [Chryseolinea soli]